VDLPLRQRSIPEGGAALLPTTMVKTRLINRRHGRICVHAFRKLVSGKWT
jgi:hypothetical protein